MQFNVPSITPEKMMAVLDSLYTQVLNGFAGQQSIYDLANEYRIKSSTNEQAIEKLINVQTAKATVTGAVTGLGGILVLPIAIPADLAGCLGIQLRMIGAIAVLRGYDPSDDQVRTFVYACLLGAGVNDLLKEVGIKVGVKLAGNLVKKIPGKILIKINQKVAFKLVTKSGEKGVINLMKLVPFVAAPISGGFNLVETKTIGKAAKKVFI